MFIRSILQDLFKLEKLIYNTKEGKEPQFSKKESIELNKKKYIILTALNKITLY